MRRRQLRYLAVTLLMFVIDEPAFANSENVSTQNVDTAQYVAFARVRRSGRPKEALRGFEGLPDAMKMDPAMQLARFELTIESKRHAEALRIGEEILQKVPNSGRVLCAMAIVHFQLGGFRDGKKLLKEAIDVDPYYARSYYEMAKVSDDPKYVISLCARGLLVVDNDEVLAKKLEELMLRVDTSVPKGETPSKTQ